MKKTLSFILSAVIALSAVPSLSFGQDDKGAAEKKPTRAERREQRRAEREERREKRDAAREAKREAKRNRNKAKDDEK